MRTKIVIEIEGGLVSSVYYAGEKPAVCIVDLDNVQIGESTEATSIEPEPLGGAPDIISESIPIFFHIDPKKAGGA